MKKKLEDIYNLKGFILSDGILHKPNNFDFDMMNYKADLTRFFSMDLHEITDDEFELGNVYGILNTFEGDYNALLDVCDAESQEMIDLICIVRNYCEHLNLNFEHVLFIQDLEMRDDNPEAIAYMYHHMPRFFFNTTMLNYFGIMAYVPKYIADKYPQYFVEYEVFNKLFTDTNGNEYYPVLYLHETVERVF